MIHRGQIWSHSWVKRSDTDHRASGIGEWVLESNVVLQGIRIRVHNPGCEHYPYYPHFEGNFDQLSTLSLDWELFWKIRVLYGCTREEKISRIKCDCVVSLCKKYMMVHTYPRHVSLALYVVFFCARIVSGMYDHNSKRGVPTECLTLWWREEGCTFSIFEIHFSVSDLKLEFEFFRGDTPADTPVEVWIMSKNHQKSPKRTFWWKS